MSVSRSGAGAYCGDSVEPICGLKPSKRSNICRSREFLSHARKVNGTPVNLCHVCR